MSYLLARAHPVQPDLLELTAFARAVSLHPDLIRAWVNLGLLDATLDSRERMWFERSQIRTVARIQRLRSGFSLNYAALGLVLDLLDRIADLEAELRARPHPRGDQLWT